MQIRVLPITFLVLHWLTIFGTWVYHHETMCCVLSWSNTTLNFDLKVKFIGFLTCFCVWPITFFWFDFGIPYLAHGCITIRWCVAYIQDPDRTLNLDLKVKFIGFLKCFCVRPITIFCFDMGLPYLVNGPITMRRCDAYIHVPNSILTLDLKVKFICFCHVFMSSL